MDKIDFGVFEDKETEEFGFPNFILDEFKLNFFDSSWGNVETIVKINKNIIFNGYAYRGKINLIKYSDRYEHDKAYNMEYVSDDGICFAYAGCDGDQYDRGYYIDRIMCQIIKLLEDRQRKEIKSVRKCYDYKRKNDLEENNDNGKVFLLSDICNYFYIEPKNEKRKNKINCPCWSVRGHYRHYKSGKVVFIKNYEKGKEKGKVKPKDKTYTI